MIDRADDHGHGRVGRVGRGNGAVDHVRRAPACAVRLGTSVVQHTGVHCDRVALLGHDNTGRVERRNTTTPAVGGCACDAALIPATRAAAPETPPPVAVPSATANCACERAAVAASSAAAPEATWRCFPLFIHGRKTAPLRVDVLSPAAQVGPPMHPRPRSVSRSYPCAAAKTAKKSNSTKKKKI